MRTSRSLGTYDVGAEPLLETANLLGIAAGARRTPPAQLKKSLPQSSYGQGQVVASPFQMARVAATVANGGAMPQGRWITDETNARTDAPEAVLERGCGVDAGQVHARGGDRRARAAVPARPRCRWRARPARPNWRTPLARLVHRLRAVRRARPRKIAFSVLVENGVYGGTAAAPAAAEIVNAAAKLGLSSTMRLFSEIEKTIERGFRRWTDVCSAQAESDELLLVHRAILEEIEGKVQTVARGTARLSVRRV